MAAALPTTNAEYIAAAPRKGQPHLQRLYKLLKSIAPKAQGQSNGTRHFISSGASSLPSPRTNRTSISIQRWSALSPFAKS
jgi:hypothetical protein